MLWTDKDRPVVPDETATTATDWVLVTRCWNCRHRDDEGWCETLDMATEENFFCADGKEKVGK